MIKLVVGEENEGVRLDKYIAENQDKFSREQVQKLIEETYVEVNGRYQKPSYKVKNEDVIRIE